MVVLDGYGLIGTEGSVTSVVGLLELKPLLVKAACNVVLFKNELMVEDGGVYADGYDDVPLVTGFTGGLGLGFVGPGLPVFCDGGFGLRLGFDVGLVNGFEYAVVERTGNGLCVPVWNVVVTVVEYTSGDVVTCDDGDE